MWKTHSLKRPDNKTLINRLPDPWHDAKLDEVVCFLERRLRSKSGRTDEL